jgi:hypothetical protein
MEPFSVDPDSLPDPVTLVDGQGTAWLLHRRRVDLRIVRRLLKDSTTLVVWADMGGLAPRPMAEADRPALWDRIRNDYGGPGGSGPTGRCVAHEFRAEPGRRMLYVAEDC